MTERSGEAVQRPGGSTDRELHKALAAFLEIVDEAGVMFAHVPNYAKFSAARETAFSLLSKDACQELIAHYTISTQPEHQMTTKTNEAPAKTYSPAEIAEAVAYFANDPELKGQPPVIMAMYYAALKRRGLV